MGNINSHLDAINYFIDRLLKKIPLSITITNLTVTDVNTINKTVLFNIHYVATKYSNHDRIIKTIKLSENIYITT